MMFVIVLCVGEVIGVEFFGLFWGDDVDFVVFVIMFMGGVVDGMDVKIGSFWFFRKLVEMLD